MRQLPYDPSDPYAIEAYARLLLDTSLRTFMVDVGELEQLEKGKGSLGQTVEEYHFFYKPNNTAGPDFPDAGVELKTTPVLIDATRKFKAKERLVFNIINYLEEHEREFLDSSFWKKNKLLLLMFYLHEQDSIDIDLVFKMIRLFRFPATDLKIIKDDWEKIRQKIRDGKAHEISEGDTFYLGACTKGANANATRPQPFSKELAKQRAYSLKPRYLNIIIEKTLKGDDELTDQTKGYRQVLDSDDVEDPLSKHSATAPDGSLAPLVKSLAEYQKGETIEDLVVRRFEPYYGLTETELFAELGIEASVAKSRYYNLAKAILNVDGERIEEFEKAEIQLKTIRIESNGTIKEHMSFPQIQYKEIVDEEWESSELFDILSRKFFFVVFQRNKNEELILKMVKFWNMPWDDVVKMQSIWTDTRQKIREGDFEHFVKISDQQIGHVRPKAANAEDLMETHLGTFEKKKSFWLDRSYILAAIS